MAWISEGKPAVHKHRGRWVVREPGYDATTGKVRPKQHGTFSTKRDALATARKAGEGRIGTSDQTLEDFLYQVWIPSKESRVEQSTLNQYLWAVDGHIVPLLGSVKLKDVSPELIDGWIRELSRAPDGGKPRIGVTSTRLARKILSMALQEAIQRDLIPKNPVAATQPPRPVRSSGRQSWTVVEAQTFLRVSRDHRLYGVFHLALVTGMRRGELLGLRWRDLDMANGLISVEQQLAVVGGRPVLKSLKTLASERLLTIGPRTVEVLRERRDKQSEEYELVGLDPRDADLVFTNEVGELLDPNNLGRILTRLAAQAGVPRITPKGLRHTAQSIGRVVVGDDKVMQERLGHADIGVTLNTYTHTETEQHRIAGDLIDGVFD